MEKDQDDLTIERPCLEILQNSEVLGCITIINDLEEGNITCYLNEENAWTVICKKCPRNPAGGHRRGSLYASWVLIKEKVSIIVLGSHGKSDIAEMLMGSVSENVIRHAKVPVLIISRDM
jgi:hypothetical protein